MKKITLILAMVAFAVVPSLAGKPISSSAADLFQPTASISETVLIDENGIKITAVDLTYSNSRAELNLLIENNSGKDLSFVSGSIGYSINAINGYMMDSGYVNSDVTSGNKSNETMSFDLAELEIYGISEIADIQVGFDISDDDYNHSYTGPLQVKTSAAEFYDYETDTYQNALDSNVLRDVYGYTIDYFTGDTLYSQNGVDIASAALLTNKDGENAIFFEAVNSSDNIVNGAVSDIAINDLIICGTTWTTSSILPGARKIYSLSVNSMIDQSCLNVFDIKEIDTFSLSFTLKDSDYNTISPTEQVRTSIAENNSGFDSSGEELYSENGIRIISKGLAPDDSEHSNDVHMLFLIENNSSDLINVDDDYGTLSVNGFMSTCSTYSTDIPAGMNSVLDIKIKDYSLEGNGITDISEITKVEIGLKIKGENYSTIAEPKIAVDF